MVNNLINNEDTMESKKNSDFESVKKMVLLVILFVVIVLVQISA